MLSLKTLFIFVALEISFVLSKSIVNEQYAIVFDAGSKGTRLYLYSYAFNVLRHLPNQKQFDSITQRLFCELGDGGIGSYQDVSQVELNFPVCIDQANEIVPLEKRGETYIGLAATAGMRLAEIRNKTFSDSLLEGIRNYFKKTGYSFKKPEQVKIITGQEEARMDYRLIFAWIASNHLGNKFQYEDAETFGIVELGGASGQIAFVPKNIDSKVTDNHITDVRINNKLYKTYSYSYLCYGTTAILNMYAANRIKNESYLNSLKVSCIPDGYTLDVTGQELIDYPCVNGMMFDSSYEFTIDKSLVDPEQTYKVKGNSKKNKCRDEVDLLIPQTECPFGPGQCSFNGVYLPPIGASNFFALGNYFEAIDYTSKLLNLNLNNDLQAFDDATYKICSMTYAELRAFNVENDAGIGKNRIAKLCLENVYILKLLKIYGFESLLNVDAVEMINQNKVNWILGYLINQINTNLDE